jgi:vitamin B12 transporter
MLARARLLLFTMIGIFGSAAAAGAQAIDVRGTVLDPSGTPIPGAHVRLLEHGSERGRAETGADGRFVIPAACAECRIEITRPGFATLNVRATNQQPLALAMTIGAVKESVVVTATGRGLSESQVGASVTVLDRDDIAQRHALSTIDLLRTVPGVVAVRTGGVGNLTGVFVRGGESTYNKVLLDGIPLNEPGGSFNFASISPENIERIEVLRGAHSALFGSDAMASVIQIFTARPDSSQPQLNLTADVGNYSTSHVAAGIGAQTRGLEYSVFGSHLRTANRAPNNENRTQTVSGRVGRRAASGAEARITARGEFGRTGVPGATAFGRPDMDAFFRHRDGDVLGGWTQPLGARVMQQASYAYIVSDQHSTNLNADPPYTPRFGALVAAFPSSDFLYDSESDLRRHRFDYRADLSLGTHQVVTGAFAYDGERGTLTNHLSTSSPQRPRRNNTGTTVQYENVAGAVSFVAGVRLEHNGSFGFYVAPRVAASWLAGPHDGDAVGRTWIRGSVGRGIKEPTFLQSYSPSPSFFGNPELKPERSRGFDVALEQRFAHDRIGVEATYFANHFDDLISLGPFDPVTFAAEYLNIGQTRASGVEVVGRGTIVAGFEVHGSYTLLDSKVVDSISSSPIFAPGQPLYRRPRHSGAVQASFTQNRFSAMVGGLFVGSRVDTDFNFPTIGSNARYATWNASGEVRFARRTAAFITIDNLADRDYMEPLGYPALGRTARVGIRTRF